MKHPYDDMLHLPHFVSKNHPPMSMRDRAAQFSPFAALTGYEDAIAEIGRLTEPKRELSEQEEAELNQFFAELASTGKERALICIQYFVPDAGKAGGAYVTATGKIKKISPTDRTITLNTGIVIGLDDIVQIREIKE
ncbi:MAG: hypothetical protein PHS41_07830 [Victivallaceae bacterium]|nr:hypothetical protein [Victivallaceae bacterium]